MRRMVLWVITLFGLALFVISQNSRATSSVRAPAVLSRGFSFTAVIHVPAFTDGNHDLRLWIPLPYEERSQAISKLKMESPVGYRIYREAEFGNRYAYLAVDTAHARAPFDVRISFHAQRFEHRVSLKVLDDIQGQPTIAIARFLQPDHLVPIDGEIARISQALTEGTALTLDKARRLYDYVITSMHYDHDGTDWGRGDAAWACDSHHGNCSDFHSLFIGMARAAGIPARFEIGFPLPANAHEGTIQSYHCWAQFYVQGLGWIPIDASEAWKNKDKRDYFFGAIDQNRMMFSMGRDIHLTPSQKGDALNYFVYPYAELDGKPFTELKSEYSFRDDPIPSGANATRAGGN
jgi:transglutaminase-like putative cysteine protease